ncbi:hypothetical protein DUI87_01515 [Hirundo rustica rustica]|uniref:Core shell protein Gag P30 domain-containing protein n=1 Tax=Hirundo rustica rustica TaxID=333673 RepID=A0A3M0L5T8_HIRRU|nr:hypothetical protein DUI87_01515 [Hirundo rustica rustica]
MAREAEKPQLAPQPIETRKQVTAGSPPASRTRHKTKKVNDENSKNEEEKHNLFPLRKIPTAPGITGYVNVPINTGDVRAFKKEIGRLMDDPFGVADRLDEFLGSSIFTFEDLTSILRSLFNNEEREMIRQAGIRDWERRNPQGAPGEQKWPSRNPGLSVQSEEDTAIRTAEKVWTHTSRVKKIEPQDYTPEWKVSSSPGDLKIKLQRHHK